jgi:AcrR family transcriptional regulator
MKSAAIPASATSRPARTQQARSEATRDALVTAARGFFGKQGYHGAGTTEVTEAAAVTRGALYHHFADKESLFDAVVLQVANDVAQAATRQVLTRQGAGQPSDSNLWERMLLALRAYLETIAADKEVQRILLLDAPAVLGWRRWQAIQAEISLPGTISSLSRLMEAGVIRRSDPEPLAQLILAAMNDAALAIAHAGNAEQALRSRTEALMHLVGGLAAHAA